MTAAFAGGDEAREIQHAIDMLIELIPDTHDRDHPDRVQRACRESFAMNARLLIDFVTGTDKRDINASDFTDTEWVPPKRAGEAPGAWEWASQNVVHLSKRPTKDSTYDVAEAKMRQVAGLIVGLLAAWMTAVVAAGHPDAAALRSSVAKAQSLL